MRIDYSIGEVRPYINWTYFFHAWNMSGKPESDQQQLRREAEERLERCGDTYRTHAVFQLFDAYSDGDDIVVSAERAKTDDESRIPCLRQQLTGSDCLCLADFIPPRTADGRQPAASQIGVFATTVDPGMETNFDRDPYEKMMMQLLADRLAEATAERMHEEVRKEYWGYARDEQLSMADMLSERWQGIRPAVGYPSLPDTSLNFVIDRLIDMRQIGIRLTESGAMKPHASVSGLLMSHPQARYFAVGMIGLDQLRDYARRRGVPVELMRKFLEGNIQ
jgi:cobalamin-dependent methionine synthase I